MKNIPRNLAGRTVSIGKHDMTCVRSDAGYRMGTRERKRYVPLLVTVDEPRRNGAYVCAGTDEQEDDEQEGLEVEERGLRWGSGAWNSRQSCLYRN